MTTTLAGRLARFAAVGGLGFLVDAGLTEALVAAGAGPLPARVLSIAVAISTTYALNRSVTFRSAARGRAAVAEGGRYAAVALAASAVNWLVFAAVMTLAPATRPALAVAAASGVAMGVSYLGYAGLVFGRQA